MNIYDRYSALNASLAKDKTLYLKNEKDGLCVSEFKGPDCRLLCYPRIGIYAGTGTSHSWLWFVDLFDRMGFYDVVFLDEHAVQDGGLDGLDVLAVSGGDTFAVAEALGPAGSKPLRSFVEHGGLYIGSCAGAYLPMNSSKEHLNLFNFVNVKITNLSKILPKAEKMPHKFCTSYGCDFIFHPVREEVRLRSNGITPFSGVPLLPAPMYGGPGMIAPGNSNILAYYEAFTDKTSFLVNKELASSTLLGRAAVVRIPMGKGCFYLFGPHFEHPHFPEANKLVADAIYWDMRQTNEKRSAFSRDEIIITGTEKKTLVRDIKRELSNSRIVAAGLELMPVQWLIGAKIYEPEKIRVFIESMWNRIKFLEKCSQIRTGHGIPGKLIEYALETTSLIRKMKNHVDRKSDTIYIAKELIDLLHKFSMAFFSLYFRTISNEILERKK
ncbi:MAG: hypothetical protein GY749_08600 [Desulfobacteraceae bacterium]|nr:hypothetical protein [Desulfobacteraceae bacterium]